ncbi:MAG: SAM hydrolase/SAM-dependent halogenase family protein [Anaerolineales bacterium]
MATITFTTDFGLRDGDVSVCKGVIKGIAPTAEIIDVTHLISPQNVREAAVVLSRTLFYFPAGTLHMFVVDPGVGTARRGLAAKIGGHYCVGPDNGALTLVLQQAEGRGWPMDFVALTETKYWRPEVSSIFHGRDIFAPVAGHLANGVPLAEFGSSFTDPMRLPIAPVQRTANGLRGEIIFTDHFGNCSSNIRAEDLVGLGALRVRGALYVRMRGAEIDGLARTFGERQPGELTALINHVGELEVAVVNGNAQQRLSVRVGDEIEVIRL